SPLHQRAISRLHESGYDRDETIFLSSKSSGRAVHGSANRGRGEVTPIAARADRRRGIMSDLRAATDVMASAPIHSAAPQMLAPEFHAQLPALQLLYDTAPIGLAFLTPDCR